MQHWCLLGQEQCSFKVACCFVQVINRDLSIAVLRYFVRQRSEEIAAGKIRRIRKPRPTPLPAAAAAADAAQLSGELSAAAPPPESASAPASISPAAQAAQPALAAPAAAATAAADGNGALDPDIRILEGLAASGLRSIRYALEVRVYLLVP